MSSEQQDENKRERLSEQNPDMMFMDGFDDCLIGTVMITSKIVACYDVELVIKKHIVGGMTEDEAWEFFEFNQLSAYVGESSPAFLIRDAG